MTTLFSAALVAFSSLNLTAQNGTFFIDKKIGRANAYNFSYETDIDNLLFGHLFRALWAY